MEERIQLGVPGSKPAQSLGGHSRTSQLADSQALNSQSQNSQPMFFAACAFALGICADTYLYQPITHWFIYCLVIAMVIIGATRKRGELGITAALLLFLPLGAVCSQLNGIMAAPPPEISEFTDDQVTVIAHVTQAGLPIRTGEPRNADDR